MPPAAYCLYRNRFAVRRIPFHLLRPLDGGRSEIIVYNFAEAKRQVRDQM
jgi:hypothetical protein